MIGRALGLGLMAFLWTSPLAAQEATGTLTIDGETTAFTVTSCTLQNPALSGAGMSAQGRDANDSPVLFSFDEKHGKQTVTVDRMGLGVYTAGYSEKDGEWTAALARGYQPADGPLMTIDGTTWTASGMFSESKGGRSTRSQLV